MELPPEQHQPPSFAAYPRGASTYGSADKLKALSDGYFGLNTIFLVNIVLAFAPLLIQASVANLGATHLAPVAAGGTVLVLGVLIGFLTYPKNKLIAYGRDWSPATALVASILNGHKLRALLRHPRLYRYAAVRCFRNEKIRLENRSVRI